jgi:outer membrane protein
MTHRQPAAIAALLALAALVPATAARAQDASVNPRIAVIDVQEVTTASAAGKAAFAQLEAFGKQRQDDLQRRREEAQRLQAQIGGGQSLSAGELAALQKQLEDKNIALQRAVDDAKREFGKKQEETLGQLERKVMPVISQLGKEKGYTLIFRKFDSGLIYVDQAIDITAEVIRRLDAAQ